MRRLLGYMRPYRVLVGLSLLFLLAAVRPAGAESAAHPPGRRQVHPPRRAPSASRPSIPGCRPTPGAASPASRSLYLARAARHLRHRVRPDVPDAVDRPTRHVRPAQAAHGAPARSRPGLLRPQSRRPPGNPRHHRRRRAQRPVRVRPGHHPRRPAGAGLHRHHHVPPEPAAHRHPDGGHAVGDRRHHDLPPQRARRATGASAWPSPRSTPTCRSTSPASWCCSSSIANGAARASSNASTANTWTPTRTPSPPTAGSIRWWNSSPCWRWRRF